MKLNTTITVYPSPFNDNNNVLITPDPIITNELDVSFILREKTGMAYAQIVNVPGIIVLTTSEDNPNIYDLTLKDLEKMFLEKIQDDPQTFLQNMFPKTLEADPNGAGSILSKMLSYIGIKASPTCSCKKRAAEMNNRGNNWCEENLDTILLWLKEESNKRKLPFVESIAKLMVKKAIKMSRKLKNEI
jgi:hypothetical protein